MQQIQIVICQIANQEYAIHIDYVERIIEYSTTTPLPETADYVLGILNYQDSVLPVIDLNKCLFKRSTNYGQESKILVIQLEDYKIGLLVDCVNEIKSIEKNNIEKPSGMIQGIAPRYIKGLIKKDEKIVIFLEMKEIFQGEQQKELIQIVQDR